MAWQRNLLILLCAVGAALAGCSSHGSPVVPSGTVAAGADRRATVVRVIRDGKIIYDAAASAPNATYTPGAPGPFHPGDTVEYKLLTDYVTCSEQIWSVLRDFPITDQNLKLPADAKTEFMPMETKIAPEHTGSTILAITFAKDTPPNQNNDTSYDTHFDFADAGTNANGVACSGTTEDSSYVNTVIVAPTPSPSPTPSPKPTATPAPLPNCSVKQNPPSVREADDEIDSDIVGPERAQLRDILLSLPKSGYPTDLAFFDGTNLHVNHRAFLPHLDIWHPIGGSATLYRNANGDIEPFPDDRWPGADARNPQFSAPVPGDGGARNRYSNVGYSWNCALVDTRSIVALAKSGSTGELDYAYEGGYTGISGNSYTSSTDAGLQIQPNHVNTGKPNGDIAAYLLEKPGTNSGNGGTILKTGGDFIYKGVFRVTAQYLVTSANKRYVAVTVDGMTADGVLHTVPLVLYADPAWNTTGAATVVKRVTSIGQTIPGACGANATACRLDGSYLRSVRWYGSFLGNNGGASRTAWTATNGAGYLCVPNDSRVSTAYTSPSEEIDSISLTTPTNVPCTH